MLLSAFSAPNCLGTGRHRRHVARPSRVAASASASASSPVAEKLKGTNVFVVGDNTDLNAALAASLARNLKYATFSTKALLEQTAKKSFAEIAEEEGEAGVALLEAMILEQLCYAARCTAATLGGGNGAAARGACWRHMYGGITVWLDLGGTAGPQKEAYEQAEIHLAGADVGALTTDQLAAETEKAIEKLVDADPKLVGKKSLYVRLGSRGDWPNLAMPGEGGPSGEAPAAAPSA